MAVDPFILQSCRSPTLGQDREYGAAENLPRQQPCSSLQNRHCFLEAGAVVDDCLAGPAGFFRARVLTNVPLVHNARDFPLHSSANCPEISD